MATQAWRNRIVGYGEEDPKRIAAHPRNWRAHPRAQAKALEGLLDEVGIVQNVIVNKRTGFLGDGHLRVALATRSGQTSIPVTYVDLDEQEEALVLASLDPVAAMAEADKAQLDSLLAEVRTDNPFIRDMLDQLRGTPTGTSNAHEAAEDEGSQLDAADELQQKWATQRGQIWIIESKSVAGQCHRLMCGDSTNESDVSRLMGSTRAALVATDPPYMVNYTGADRPGDGGKDWSDKYHEIGINVEQFMRRFVTVTMAHARDDAAWFIWHASPRAALWERVLDECGILVHQPIIWVKPTFTFGFAKYRWAHEPCFFGWRKGHPPYFPPGWFDQNHTTVWEVDYDGKAHIVGNAHPTQKPVELFARPMRNHTRPGAICYEPFCGSGSQLIAGEREGRLVYAMEIEPAFVAVALERLTEIGLQPRLSE